MTIFITDETEAELERDAAHQRLEESERERDAARRELAESESQREEQAQLMQAVS